MKNEVARINGAWTKTHAGRTVRNGVKSIALGLGSCIAVYGGQYNRTSWSLHVSDTDLLKSDWFAVGNDLRSSATPLTKKC